MTPNPFTQLRELIDLLEDTINGKPYRNDDDVTLDLTNGTFMVLSQSSDGEGIYYDIFEEDPRDNEPDSIDGGLLEVSTEEQSLDALGLISKLAFLLQ